MIKIYIGPDGAGKSTQIKAWMRDWYNWELELGTNYLSKKEELIKVLENKDNRAILFDRMPSICGYAYNGIVKKEGNSDKLNEIDKRINDIIRQGIKDKKIEIIFRSYKCLADFQVLIKRIITRGDDDGKPINSCTHDACGVHGLVRVLKVHL